MLCFTLFIWPKSRLCNANTLGIEQSFWTIILFHSLGTVEFPKSKCKSSMLEPCSGGTVFAGVWSFYITCFRARTSAMILFPGIMKSCSVSFLMTTFRDGIWGKASTQLVNNSSPYSWSRRFHYNPFLCNMAFDIYCPINDNALSDMNDSWHVSE